MKRISEVAVLAALCALPVLGLAADKPAAKPAEPMKAEAKKEAPAPAKMEVKEEKPMAMKVEAKEEKPMAAPTGRMLTAKSREDARECLKLQTNKEVIVCAEKFM